MVGAATLSSIVMVWHTSPKELQVVTFVDKPNLESNLPDCVPKVSLLGWGPFKPEYKV